MLSLRIISLQGLGNSILNLPLILGLKNKFDLSVMCFSNGSSQFYQEFLPKLTERIPSVGSIIKKSSKGKYDLAVSLFPNYKREAAALLLTKANRKIMPKLPRCILHSLMPINSLTIDPEIHDLENNCDLLSEVDKDFAPDFAGIATVLKQKTLPKEEPHSLVIHPTASTPLKYYRLDFWRSLIEKADLFEKIYITCGKNQIELNFCNEIIKDVSTKNRARIRILSGAPFSELVATLDTAALVIGLDSSVCHLSALMNKNTICLWSYANIKRIYPYGNKVQIYIPKEIFEGARPEKKAENVSKHLERANPIDVLNIFERTRAIDYTIRPRFKDPVYLYNF